MPIFLSLMLLGLGLLFFSLLLGHDHDFDHGDLDGDHGPGLFNTKIVGSFLMAFGAVGALARFGGTSMTWSSVAGVAGGAAFGALMFALLRLLWAQQASSHVTREDLIGKTAVVEVAITGGGLGEVALQTKGSSITYLARAEDDQFIPAGALVKISSIAGDTARVRRA